MSVYIALVLSLGVYVHSPATTEPAAEAVAVNSNHLIALRVWKVMTQAARRRSRNHNGSTAPHRSARSLTCSEVRR